MKGIFGKLFQKRGGASQPRDESSDMWCRIVMDKATHKLVSALNYKKFAVLEISGEKWKDFGFESYRSLSYPDFDICAEALSEKFDLIIAEQVFEHLLYPYRAAKNIHAMLSDGGYFLLTTPFMIKFHPAPYDCTRWSEVGMKYFLSECGFSLENIQTGSWGNRKCVIENFDVWKKFDQTEHSLINDPQFPLVVWTLARR